MMFENLERKMMFKNLTGQHSHLKDGNISTCHPESINDYDL